MENINLLRRVKYLLRLYGVSPRKRLGQNFTINHDILHRLVAHASLIKDDVVLEVGAGFGFLTPLLANKCKKVIAVEVDPILVNFLKEQFHSLQNVEWRKRNLKDITFNQFYIL